MLNRVQIFICRASFARTGRDGASDAGRHQPWKPRHQRRGVVAVVAIMRDDGYQEFQGEHVEIPQSRRLASITPR